MFTAHQTKDTLLAQNELFCVWRLYFMVVGSDEPSIDTVN